MTRPSTDTLCRRFWDQVTARPSDAPALAMPGHAGLTWAAYADQVRRLAPGFAGLGVRAGDKVALLMGPRPEFHLVDTAVLHARGVPFSLALGETVEQMAYQLRLTQTRLLVAEADQRERARELAAATDGALQVVVVGDQPRDGSSALPTWPPPRQAG